MGKKSKNDPDVLDEVILSTILSNIHNQFEVIIGNTYYLYKRAENTYFVSLVEPVYWDRDRIKIDFISNVTYTQQGLWEPFEH